jgi:virulence factor
MDKVKVAIIAAGAMVNAAHAPSLATLEDVELVGICDLILSKAEETAAKFGIPRVFVDYREMIEQTNPDAVWIVLWPHLVPDIANTVIEMGKHVFTEKPPGVYTEQTRQMANNAKRHGVLTCVGFQRRYTPITVHCWERVLARGPMYQCLSTFMKWYDGGPYYGGATDVLYSDVIHAVDTLRWMAGGEASDVYSDIQAHGAEFSTAHNALVRFDSGAVGFLQANWRVGARQLRMEMHGDGISCLVTPEEGAVIYEQGKPAETLVAADLAGGPEMFRIGFLQEARHFIDCIKSGRQPDTSLAEALKTMKLCDAISRNSPPWTKE